MFVFASFQLYVLVFLCFPFQGWRELRSPYLSLVRCWFNYEWLKGTFLRLVVMSTAKSLYWLELEYMRTVRNNHWWTHKPNIGLLQGPKKEQSNWINLSLRRLMLMSTKALQLVETLGLIPKPQAQSQNVVGELGKREF